MECFMEHRTIKPRAKTLILFACASPRRHRKPLTSSKTLRAHSPNDAVATLRSATASVSVLIKTQAARKRSSPWLSQGLSNYGLPGWKLMQIRRKSHQMLIAAGEVWHSESDAIRSLVAD